MQYTPLGYFEVVPGDTISGNVEFKVFSDTTIVPAFNRTFFDVIAVYMPYRLMWDGFTEFLIHGTGTPPTVTNLNRINFENFYHLPKDTAGTSNAAWQRRMYNRVWNRFVRRADEAEAGEDDNNLLACSYRPSTFQESVPEADSLTPATIDTSGSTLSVDDIRDAFNSDHFNKIRDYYGDRYVDYLASVGVQADWSVIEEPELLTKLQKQLEYQITNPATANTTTPEGPEGNPGGYWTGNFKMKISGKFFPEHGLIGFYALPKMEVFQTEAGRPHLSFNEQEDFWSPRS